MISQKNKIMMDLSVQKHFANEIIEIEMFRVQNLLKLIANVTKNQVTQNFVAIQNKRVISRPKAQNRTHYAAKTKITSCKESRKCSINKIISKFLLHRS